MTALEMLQKAREHLSDPENWNQDGHNFRGGDRSTGCCCALGALILFNGDDDAFSALQSALPADRLFVSLYNDHLHTTHADILAMYDRAIASVEGEA